MDDGMWVLAGAIAGALVTWIAVRPMGPPTRARVLADREVIIMVTAMLKAVGGCITIPVKQIVEADDKSSIIVTWTDPLTGNVTYKVERQNAPRG